MALGGCRNPCILRRCRNRLAGRAYESRPYRSDCCELGGRALPGGFGFSARLQRPLAEATQEEGSLRQAFVTAVVAAATAHRSRGPGPHSGREPPTRSGHLACWSAECPRSDANV